MYTTFKNGNCKTQQVTAHARKYVTALANKTHMPKNLYQSHPKIFKDMTHHIINTLGKFEKLFIKYISGITAVQIFYCYTLFASFTSTTTGSTLWYVPCGKFFSCFGVRFAVIPLTILWFMLVPIWGQACTCSCVVSRWFLRLWFFPVQRTEEK